MRMPRLTTRRWIILVAIVAVALVTWNAIERLTRQNLEVGEAIVMPEPIALPVPNSAPPQ
jgi:hypothetical protein